MTRPAFVISSSYGNDSMALIQWMYRVGIRDAEVVFIDTGWGSPEWGHRVALGEFFARAVCGYTVTRLKPDKQFKDLITFKKGFPGQKYQWCSLHLKVVPFLEYMDHIDPNSNSTIVIGKRRVESQSRADTPEVIPCSEIHGDRRVWHPLYRHTDEQRDALLAECYMEPLPHRSMECSPCVNANRADMKLVEESRIQEIVTLEAKVNNTMFRPYRHMGATGIREVMRWAHSKRGKYAPSDDEETTFCTTGYCGI